MCSRDDPLIYISLSISSSRTTSSLAFAFLFFLPVFSQLSFSACSYAYAVCLFSLMVHVVVCEYSPTIPLFSTLSIARPYTTPFLSHLFLTARSVSLSLLSTVCQSISPEGAVCSLCFFVSISFNLSSLSVVFCLVVPSQHPTHPLPMHLLQDNGNQ